MRYVRIHTDADGQTHFEDLDVALAPSDFAPPAPPLLVSEPVPAEQAVLFTAPAGWYGDWHPTPRRQYYVQCSGELEVQVGDGETRRLHPGDIVLLEDTTGRGHTTRVIGDGDVRALFVQLPD